ncbi:uncharacterized protein LODBEIA_P49710 [Lodderomyces beijingensis]|uniref:Transcriptional coactivator p15 (PC4) C-terminal domain-containing protein n=1 Tax=Lodderomyces beijingensis TaxID=1775926 RepID=A0ABP0ZTP8_9ASCO
MPPKRTYSPTKSRAAASSDTGGGEEIEIVLDSKKRVTVRKFKDINLVDIREYWTDSSGERKPGKKGISLTEDTYFELIQAHNKIQNALDKLNGVGGGATKKARIEKSPKKANKDDGVGKEAKVGKEDSGDGARDNEAGDGDEK